MKRIATLLSAALIACAAHAQEASQPASGASAPQQGSKEWFEAEMARLDAEQKAQDDAAALPAVHSLRSKAP